MENKVDSKLQTSPTVNVNNQNEPANNVNTSITLSKNSIDIDADNKSH
jgi:hypothetical protein